MPQQTNLNVSPYFDDFNSDNNYSKVLFKPGYPVQARELTTLQSILQNQIEKFGQHFFKEGAKVIPGNTGYNAQYYAVELNNSYLGVPVEAYASQLIGTKITGQTSGVTAVVDNVLFAANSERGNLTLYLNYLSSSTTNNSTKTFSDGEGLLAGSTINSGLLGNSTIQAGQTFAITLANNATSIGSAFTITEGVYFIRGQFVRVATETLILDQYSNTSNYRIGLFVNEEIVTPDIDESLNDNSQGFNNYSAPGADRFRISVSLFKKSLDDFNDDNFVELASVKSVKSVDAPAGAGVLTSQKTNTDYSNLSDELARRTYAESGDYCVTPFDVSVKESLNDQLGNRGIFNVGQFTYGGSVPTDDLAVYQISPGKAFVRGYEIQTTNPTFLDVPKPRTTKTLENQAINYNTGPTLILNRVYGSPVIGIGNTYVLSLRNERVGIASTIAPGKEIGLSRVYDFRLESGSYNTSNSNINQWYISLYDIQTITEISLNEPITLSVPTFIKGNNSGATAFLKESVSNSSLLTVYEKTGEFITNESFTIDGIANGRVATAITSYGISDVKSVYGVVGSGSTFTADVLQSTSFFVGIATISTISSGISTVTSPNILFPGNSVKKDNLISYSDSSLSDPVFAKVVSVGTTTITISGVTTVTGIAEGKLPTATLSVTDFQILTTNLEDSTDTTLYTKLPKNNISSVDLTNASLTIRKSYPVVISNNQLTTAAVAGPNETFLPFDEERYSLIRSDGSTEVLTSDKFSFTSGSTQLQIYNLGSNDTGATLVTTLTKIKPKAKSKLKNRVNSVIVDKSKYNYSGIGGTTINDGLTFGNYPYGTRVQDENICLNVPDVIEIHSIYESLDTTDPSAPTAVLLSITSPSTTTSELIIGEKITGQTSGAIAICAEKLTNTQISFIHKNQNTFKEGETLVFEESNIRAIVVTLNIDSFNISSNYTFSTGQEGTFYDFGVINRKSDSDEPTKRLKIYFQSGYYQSSDDGDITTVNSYDTFDYVKEIQNVNTISNSDIIDIRPRTSSYTVSENSRSPLEFYGRSFSASGNSAANVLASDESILTTFSFYLGRIDRIYLSKDGKFQVKYGTPAERPEKPVSVDDAIEVASIFLPPYLYKVSQSSIEFLDYKRYRMVDIKQLENRIKNLEYYTSLSLLETNTAGLFVPDSNGLNRFKSGFFVDNFTSLLAQENGAPYKNSIDLRNKELRPQHYTNSVDLIAGPVINVDPNADLQFSPPEGVNIRKSSDIITLDYAEREWFKQTFATRSESVTPFLISFWQGTLELTPASDTWVDTTRIEAKIINTEGNYAETLATASRTLNVDPQTGFSPTVWNAWETNWTGQDVAQSTSTRTESSSSTVGRGGWINGGEGGPAAWVETTTDSVIQDTLRTITDTGVQTRTGNRTIITEQFDQTSVGDRVISRNLISFMRSRNIQFISKKVKPLTQLYAFFDGVDVTKYCVPKLLEINMISGVFQTGETVIGSVPNTGLGPNDANTKPGITFRVAQPNHKEGPYDAATTTFSLNPYTSQVLQGTYSSTSTILNVDTFSLSNEPQGQFSGRVESGMVLVGKTSGAQATITNVRLISDVSAILIGSFNIPNPNINVHPKFETGSKVFTIINNDSNDQNVATTIAEEGFTSSGTLETVQENIISVRNARIQNKQEFEDRAISRTTGTQVISSQAIGGSSSENIIGWYDPLAQSFLVEDSTGVFLTRCDVFFRSKDDVDIPVTFQIRTMQGGFPTTKILPFSEIILEPNQVSTSGDGSVATSFVFKAPVYLEGGQEYCVCLASNSTKYSVYICRIGENDLLTQTFISNQPTLGSLFKSQNASTWEPSQWEDLKFTLYRADFIQSGSVEFYSPELTEGNKQIATLLPDSLNLNSRKIRVGLGSTVQDSGLTLGNTVLQQGSNATGNFVGSAGISTGTLNVINAGIGYTPSSGSFTYSSVNLDTITGSGQGATANITISNGSVVSTGVTIASGGSGYQVGDVLGITTIGSLTIGQNARFSVGIITGVNQLILDNVQGDFITGAGKTVQYINNSGLTTTLNSSVGGNVAISAINVVSDGLSIVVNHKNHGMYSNTDLVSISGAISDVKPTKLTSGYTFDSTSAILVDDSSAFSTFENVGVGTTNAGYLLIGNEIISYTSTSSGSIGGQIVRGSNPINYATGTPVYKYELNGVSLRRINKIHNLSNVTTADSISFDSYTIKLDTSSNTGTARSTSSGYPILYLNQTKSAGGYNIKASQNMPFEIITPMIQNVTVTGTSLSSEIRTISASSISGNEIPFIDTGFDNITLNQVNYLDSPRMIASKVNETQYLSTLPGNKSMNLRVFLNTIDSRLSPVIDTQRVSVILTSNRVNSVITNYAEDSRVNSIFDDPTAFQYLSKEITLENPGTSIKILLSAYNNLYSDIRAFYAISENQNFNPIFVPFPGYENLNSRGQIIDIQNNNGHPDTFVPLTSNTGFSQNDVPFSEYTFTADQLPPFRSYRIKIIMTSTNQVYVPRLKDLRVIALA
jgi:hypothetical protein